MSPPFLVFSAPLQRPPEQGRPRTGEQAPEPPTGREGLGASLLHRSLGYLLLPPQLLGTLVSCV